MELISGFFSFVLLIIGIIVLIAIISIADNTKKTNDLLRLMLHDKNPEKFQYSGSKIVDKTSKNRKY